MRVPRWAYALVVIGGVLLLVGITSSCDPSIFGSGVENVIK